MDSAILSHDEPVFIRETRLALFADRRYGIAPSGCMREIAGVLTHIDLAGSAASGTVRGAGGRTRPDRSQRCLDRSRGHHPHLPDSSLSPRQQKERCGTRRVFSIVDTP